MIKDNRIISIIGTAKNAGKTTVLNRIIKDYHNQVLAITSIGLDGEKIDNVTFKEKPQITVSKHTIIATAESCLAESTIEYVIYEKTGINTPLGEIVIIEVTKEGDVLVAGPSANYLMKEIINKFLKYNPVKILIDGALFRKSIASTKLVDSIIVVTGASYHSDMLKVVNDTFTFIKQLTLEKTKNQTVLDYGLNENYFLNNQTKYVIKKSLIANEEELLDGIKSYETLCLKGALTSRMVDLFITHRNELVLKDIIVHDGSHILLNDDQYQKLTKLGITVTSYQQIHLLFVAYNPTSPYQYQFDNMEFKKQLQTTLKQNVVNVCMDLE